MRLAIGAGHCNCTTIAAVSATGAAIARPFIQPGPQPKSYPFAIAGRAKRRTQLRTPPVQAEAANTIPPNTWNPANSRTEVEAIFSWGRKIIMPAPMATPTRDISHIWL